MNILKVLTERRMTGNFGEDAAARYLKRNGYRIISKNHVEDPGEIDVIAKDREYIVFVEVKTRLLGTENPNEPRPASAVTPEKQRKLIAAASCYLAFNPTPLKVRLDVIEVYYEMKNGKRRVSGIEHLEGAFNKNTAYTKGYKI